MNSTTEMYAVTDSSRRRRQSGRPRRESIWLPEKQTSYWQTRAYDEVEFATDWEQPKSTDITIKNGHNYGDCYASRESSSRHGCDYENVPLQESNLRIITSKKASDISQKDGSAASGLHGEKRTENIRNPTLLLQRPKPRQTVPKRLQETRQSPRFRWNRQLYPINIQQYQQRLHQAQKENRRLRQLLQRALEANQRLRHDFDHRIVLEAFEGESKKNHSFSSESSHKYSSVERITAGGLLDYSNEDLLSMEQELENLESSLETSFCPIEPTITFGDALRDRAFWLVGLLAMQSCSGFILSHNEALLADHPIIIYYLTMLVGAGGNAGNQASVRVIRGLALGTLNRNTQRQFLTRELKMATALSAILSLAGFLRAVLFRTPLPETMAITTALTVIVFSSICLGAALPLLLKRLGIDPAHSSTTIQVMMDILGVLLTVLVSSLLLDSPLGQMLIGKLSVGA